MTAQERKVTGKRVNKTDKTLVVPMTPQAFDACSQSGDFIDVLLIQTVNSHVLNLVPEDERGKYASAAAAALVGTQPKGELEGMLAAQLIACHNAAMECYRRAMNSELPARDHLLNQANKLSRTYSTLLETLNHHRGKGQQKVTVEHVHVHAGRSGCGRHGREPRGRGSHEIKGSTPCKSHCRCISAPDAERGREAAAGANHQRCPTGVAGCTAERLQAHLKAIAMLGSMAIIPRKQSHSEG